MVHAVDAQPVPATLEARHEYTLDETPVHHIYTEDARCSPENDNVVVFVSC